MRAPKGRCCPPKGMKSDLRLWKTWANRPTNSVGIVPHETEAAPCFHGRVTGDDRSMIVMTPQLVAAFAALLPGLAALVWSIRRKP